MTLRDIVSRLEEFDGDGTIYVDDERPHWGPDSRAVVVEVGCDEDRVEEKIPVEAAGLTYFLEVGIALEEVIHAHEGQLGRRLTVDERLEAVIHYARYDSYSGRLSRLGQTLAGVRARIEMLPEAELDDERSVISGSTAWIALDLESDSGAPLYGSVVVVLQGRQELTPGDWCEAEIFFVTPERFRSVDISVGTSLPLVTGAMYPLDEGTAVRRGEGVGVPGPTVFARAEVLRPVVRTFE